MNMLINNHYFIAECLIVANFVQNHNFSFPKSTVK